MTIEATPPLVQKFIKAGVQYRYGWDAVDSGELEYAFEYVLTNVRFDNCTLPQMKRVVSLIFDDGYKGKFIWKNDDFYQSLRSYIERSLLDKLLEDFNEDNRQLVIAMIEIIDNQYGG
jgi:hypothetical protein